MGQLRKRGNVWWMRYYRGGQRLEESARTSNYDEARERMKSREGDIADGRPVSPKAASLRFDQAAADLETEYTVNGRRTLKKLKRLFKLHLTLWFGERRLVEIDTADVRAYTAARLEAKAAPATVNRELAALKRMFSLAVKDGRLHAKPYIPMLQEHNVRRGFFERPQFDAVKNHLPAALQGVLRLSDRLAPGVRDSPDRMAAGRLDRPRGAPGPRHNEERGGAQLPFTAALETLLTAQQADHERLAQAGRIVPYVFHRNGKRIRDLRDAWVSACTAAGLPGKLLHDFRRSAVRNLERAGVSRSAAMAMVGHKTESIYRRYAIVDAGALRDAAAKIDQATGVVSPKGKLRMAKAAGTQKTKGTIAGTVDRTASA